MNTELVKGSKTKAEGSSKRAGDELEQEKAKKQKGDDDQEEAEMKSHIKIVKDDEVAIDAIPLATKPLVIVDYKIDKDGRIEDLETLWKLVKAKHENTRPEDDYERVLWGDLKVMFEPDIKSEVWRSLQGYKVTVWKLFDNCGVHFVRYHFIKDHIIKGDIQLHSIPITYQLVDIFTKPLDEPTFTILKAELGLYKNTINDIPNYLRECWCTVVVDLPKPPTNDSEPRPLKESIIRFIVKNGFDYTQDEALRSTPSVQCKMNFYRNPYEVQPIELTAYMLDIIKHESSVSLNPSFEKVGKKRKTYTMTNPKPKSHGSKVSRVPPKENKVKKKPKTKNTSLVQTTLELTKEKESSGALIHHIKFQWTTCLILKIQRETRNSLLQDCLSYISMRALAHHNLFLRETLLIPKTSNKYLVDMDFLPRLLMKSFELALRLIKPSPLPLRQTLTQKGKTSSKVELDFNSPAIQTFGDFQFLLEDSEEKLKGFSNEEILYVGEGMKTNQPLELKKSRNLLNINFHHSKNPSLNHPSHHLKNNNLNLLRGIRSPGSTRKKPDALFEPFDYESSSNTLAYKDLDDYVFAFESILAKTLQGFNEFIYA
ncbi:hypothetical protein Tco_1503921 [Tanacetum coccineum]